VALTSPPHGSACSLCGCAARPAKGHKKGEGTGIDGCIDFFDGKSGQAKQVIVQVKNGYVGLNHVRDLKGVLERGKAPTGALITLREPTKPMATEAPATGFCESGHFPGRYLRREILTIADLLAGKRLQCYTHRVGTFAKAERKTKSEQEQLFRVATPVRANLDCALDSRFNLLVR
jgi:site-specific DNA-methyltransferase (adenine-specific)